MIIDKDGSDIKYYLLGTLKVQFVLLMEAIVRECFFRGNIFPDLRSRNSKVAAP